MKEILVVDDEPKMRNLIRIYLENAKYSVQEAPDGETALQVIRKTNLHLIILDIMMPGIPVPRYVTKIRISQSSC